MLNHMNLMSFALFQDKFDSRLPQPYRDEMKGLADAAGLNVGMLRPPVYDTARIT